MRTPSGIAGVITTFVSALIVLVAVVAVVAPLLWTGLLIVSDNKFLIENDTASSVVLTPLLHPGHTGKGLDVKRIRCSDEICTKTVAARSFGSWTLYDYDQLFAVESTIDGVTGIYCPGPSHTITEKERRALLTHFVLPAATLYRVSEMSFCKVNILED